MEKKDVENTSTCIKSNANQLSQAENPNIRKTAEEILALVKYIEEQVPF